MYKKWLRSVWLLAEEEFVFVMANGLGEFGLSVIGERQCSQTFSNTIMLLLFNCVCVCVYSEIQTVLTRKYQS